MFTFSLHKCVATSGSLCERGVDHQVGNLEFFCGTEVISPSIDDLQSWAILILEGGGGGYIAQGGTCFAHFQV